MIRTLKNCCSRWRLKHRCAALGLAVLMLTALGGCGARARDKNTTLRVGVALYTQDDTFGGDRWDSEREEITRTIGARTPARPARPAGGGYTTGGYTTNTPWSGGGSVYTYKAKPQPQEKPLASVRRGATAPTTHLMQINKGDMVEHTAFGRGMVMSMRPMGGDALIEVAFDTVGTKKLMLKSAGAHMKKV